MANHSELGDFLVARRGRVTPAMAGLPIAGNKRRVPGLRREEVASLAGISVEYYIRLERGTPGQVSEQVLESVSRALQLDPDEQDHLVRLVRAAAPQSTDARRRAVHRTNSPGTVRPSVQRMLDLLPTPAYVRNARFDVLVANPLGRALYQTVFDSPTNAYGQPSMARYAFLDPSAGDFFVHIDRVRDDVIAHLHAQAARSPYDTELSNLIGQLCTRSATFRALWAEQNVRFHRAGTKVLHHPVVGRLNLDVEALDLAADEGLRLNVYTAAPDTPDAANLAFLANWAGEVPHPSGRQPNPDGTAEPWPPHR